MTFPGRGSSGVVLAAACLALAACQFKAPRSQPGAAARTTAVAAVAPVREAAPAPARPSASTSRATPPQLVAVEVDEPPLILLEQEIDEAELDGLDDAP